MGAEEWPRKSGMRDRRPRLSILAAETDCLPCRETPDFHPQQRRCPSRIFAEPDFSSVQDGRPCARRPARKKVFRRAAKTTHLERGAASGRNRQRQGARGPLTAAAQLLASVRGAVRSLDFAGRPELRRRNSVWRGAEPGIVGMLHLIRILATRPFVVALHTDRCRL